MRKKENEGGIMEYLLKMSITNINPIRLFISNVDKTIVLDCKIPYFS